MNRRERIAVLVLLAGFLAITGGQGYAAHGWLGVPVYIATGTVLLAVVWVAVGFIDRWIQRGKR